MYLAAALVPVPVSELRRAGATGSFAMLQWSFIGDGAPLLRGAGWQYGDPLTLQRLSMDPILMLL